jgi:uncharacterized protein YndB with AHSA1/START domain
VASDGSRTTVIETPSDLEVVAIREFDAPIGLVYEVLTKPEHLRQTLAPFEEELIKADFDLRVGGDYHYVFVPDGGPECSFRGTYLEIEPPHRVVATWHFDGWPDVEAVESDELEEHDGVTTVKWRLTFRDRAGREHMKSYDGIEANLEKIDALLKRLVDSPGA